ncbi:DUF4956 domain-containing protein [Specibacter sp. NPDC057265]|uniref:DUF4956 domain-containing protein n=1 Tax=Specibacter sp. NPDC057265 TaxID=3346075 RepID=UPI00362C82F6
MNFWIALAADVVAITVLVYAVYFPRHFRKDLALAYVSLNVGILAVTMLLADSGAGVGLGMGLFGILSIIRLRSDTLTQEEVAYYFMALAIGLVNGLHPDPAWLAPALSFGLVAMMFLADNRRFSSRTQRQQITLDMAHCRQDSLEAALSELLDADIMRTVVLELDTVRDLTVVDVRFRTRKTSANNIPGMVNGLERELLGQGQRFASPSRTQADT